MPRPCPFVSCIHNLFLDVGEDGSIKRRHDEPWDMPADASCALDVADGGPQTCERVAEVLGVSPGRVSQIETVAHAALREELESWRQR